MSTYENIGSVGFGIFAEQSFVRDAVICGLGTRRPKSHVIKFLERFRLTVTVQERDIGSTVPSFGHMPDVSGRSLRRRLVQVLATTIEIGRNELMESIPVLWVEALPSLGVDRVGEDNLLVRADGL